MADIADLLKTYNEETSRLRAERDVAIAEVARRADENERLRKVLEFVEHGGRLTVGYECPCCGRIGKSTGIVHWDGCDLGRALNRPECLEQPKEDERA